MTLQLTLSDRLHQIIRQTSIRTIYEALVEIITNADDAYRRQSNSNKDIVIEIHRFTKYPNKTSLTVIDQASGLKYSALKKNLLVVGTYTAGENCRGMMGRGIKDCSFLGDIIFTSIRKNKLNQLIIHQNRTADILKKNIPVTSNLRSKYKIKDNGCHVRLIVDSSLVPDINILTNNLRNNIYLRNLFHESNVILKEKSEERSLKYTFPSRKLIIQCDYDLPDYNTSAHLEIYRTSAQLPSSFNPDLISYGILVGSDQSIFECSALYHKAVNVQDQMWNPNIRYITGKLVCKDIDRIAREAIDGKINSLNPYLLIDPNRRNGLIKDHPFTLALYGPAYRVLNVILNRVQDTRDDQMLEFGNAKEVVASLNNLITDLIPSDNVLYTWRDKETHAHLASLSREIKNVTLDSEFIGLSWEEIQNLIHQKYRGMSPETKSVFKISFTSDSNLRDPYQILYLPGQINMKININDPSIQPYVEIKEEGVNLINTGKALTAIGFLVLEATNHLLIRNQIMTGKTISLDLNSYNEYLYQLSQSRQYLVPKIQTQILEGISSLKME